MLKTKLAGVVAAVVLLSAGAANATQSVFPSSPNEAKPFSFPYEGMRDVRSGAGAAGTSFPSSPSEATAHSVPAAERSIMAERLSRTYGSVFPSSVNETGSL